MAVDPAPEEAGAGRRRNIKRALVEWPLLVLVALVLALLIRTFLVQAFYIDSGSMEPTLQIDDRVLVNKIAYVTGEPERGDIVVLRQSSPEQAEVGPLERLGDVMTEGFRPTSGPPEDIIKRIVGLPGESVELRDGVVYVDGVEVPEQPASAGGYLGSPDDRPWGPETVPDDHFMMLGDNRRWSQDSRNGMGMIARDEIVGRSFVTIYPLNRIGLL